MWELSHAFEQKERFQLQQINRFEKVWELSRSIRIFKKTLEERHYVLFRFFSSLKKLNRTKSSVLKMQIFVPRSRISEKKVGNTTIFLSKNRILPNRKFLTTTPKSILPDRHRISNRRFLIR
ncbi:hypothetical protein DLM75_11075 [Leptospira stimsonii]|uniref:Uncharacterized protein n=1 Tax=Leptospira stimsonii TaxID=2202203 RepID=A0A396ZB99_9LEPT|nr:hypothetical protein DLM75_11075 [Leptospira stimsonii]